MVSEIHAVHIIYVTRRGRRPAAAAAFRLVIYCNETWSVWHALNPLNNSPREPLPAVLRAAAEIIRRYCLNSSRADRRESFEKILPDQRLFTRKYIRDINMPIMRFLFIINPFALCIPYFSATIDAAILFSILY